jgi:periplasmic copper chaperone A
MTPQNLGRRVAASVGACSAIALIVAGAASAHARLSPPVSVSGKLQLYSLAIPTEKENLYTTKIVMTVPKGFGIDSFVPPPAGWTMHLQQTGSGDSAVVQKVTWTGGHVATGYDSLFQFLAQPAHTGTYTFDVQQTYSDNSIVDWSEPETGANPAPSIEVKDSLGGGGVSTLDIVALVLGAVGVLLGGFALVSRGGSGGSGGARQLA